MHNVQNHEATSMPDLDSDQQDSAQVAALAASQVHPESALPSRADYDVPSARMCQPAQAVDAREFVLAVAHNFDAYSEEDDERYCRGCSALIVIDGPKDVTNHQHDCIVPRAKAWLAASPAAAPEAAHADDLTDEQCDQIAARALDTLAAKLNMHPTEVSTDTNGHWSWRRALIRAGAAHAQQAAAPAELSKASVKDMLRWLGVDTDYHGKIAFTLGQFARFVDMLRAAVSPSDATGKAVAASAGAQAINPPKFPAFNPDGLEGNMSPSDLWDYACLVGFRCATSAADARDAERLQALHAAVSALYFDDSSDFRSALGTVVRHLDRELAGEMLGSPKAAYNKVCAAIAASRKGGEA